MVGTLAQLISLVSHGNAFLRKDLKLNGFYPSNSTFQFCNKVHFVDVKKSIRIKETEIARDPNSWLEYLKNNACERLEVIHSSPANRQYPDHLSAAFIGGGARWEIVAKFARYEDRWYGSWEVTDQNAQDRRIWKVTYLRETANVRLSNSSRIDLATCSSELKNVLQRIETFARRQKLEGFANCFNNGLKALSSNDPIALIYHKDLLSNTGYTLEAKQLVAAASLAWVFGGMGSWNDLGFEKETDQQEYESLSGELYSAINISIESSTNSFGN